MDRTPQSLTVGNRRPRASSNRRLAGIAFVLVVALAPAASAFELPSGFKTVARERLGKGVEHATLLQAGKQMVHVANIAPHAPFVLRSVLSAQPLPTGIGPPRAPERTSSMCLRARCLVAVNGDFWEPKTGEPVGGVVSGGQLLRSPSNLHNQLVIARSGKLLAGPLRWTGRLVPTDLKGLNISGVNIPRFADHIVLYTPASGHSTQTPASGVEMTLKMRPGKALRLDRTSVVSISGVTRGKGNGPIPRNGAVLAGHGKGAQALLDLAKRVRNGDAAREALLRLESQPDAFESIGGTPVLVRNGRVVFPNLENDFTRGRHPRTIVGRTRSGHVLLVTVDGRQAGYSDGMTLAEAARMMLELGAVDAINLDGGGSTTFVTRGAVRNRPSDRLVRAGLGQRLVRIPDPGQHVVGNVERPVAGALVLVPQGSKTLDAVDAQLLKGLELPDEKEVAAPIELDPASDPTGHLPALVNHTSGTGDPVRPLAAMLATAAVGMTSWADPRMRKRVRAALTVLKRR